MAQRDTSKVAFDRPRSPWLDRPATASPERRILRGKVLRVITYHCHTQAVVKSGEDSGHHSHKMRSRRSTCLRSIRLPRRTTIRWLRQAGACVLATTPQSTTVLKLHNQRPLTDDRSHRPSSRLPSNTCRRISRTFLLLAIRAYLQTIMRFQQGELRMVVEAVVAQACHIRLHRDITTPTIHPPTHSHQLN